MSQIQAPTSSHRNSTPASEQVRVTPPVDVTGNCTQPFVKCRAEKRHDAGHAGESHARDPRLQRSLSQTQGRSVVVRQILRRVKSSDNHPFHHIAKPDAFPTRGLSTTPPAPAPVPDALETAAAKLEAAFKGLLGQVSHIHENQCKQLLDLQATADMYFALPENAAHEAEHRAVKAGAEKAITHLNNWFTDFDAEVNRQRDTLEMQERVVFVHKELGRNKAELTAILDREVYPALAKLMPEMIRPRNPQ